MAHTDYATKVEPPSTTEHWLSGAVAFVGLLAAAIGLWYAWADAGATFGIFGWTASVDAASTWLAPLLLIGGGGLATLSMGTESFRDFRVERTLATGVEALLALLGIVAVVFGVVAMF